MMGTIELRVVKLFPTTTCSCPEKINCYHIKAAEMAVGLHRESTKHRITLTQLRRNKRKKADKTSGRKRPRTDDVDVVPAGDVDDEDMANFMNAIIAPAPPAVASAIEDDIDNEDVLCGTCQLPFLPNSRAKKCNWIACDSCRTWFHNSCIGPLFLSPYLVFHT